MRLERWNGERWWVDDRPVLSRLLRWVVWVGGWPAHRHGDWTVRQRLGMLTPVSLFGHRVTFYGWGAQAKVCGGWWVHTRRPTRQVYFSPDGTPDAATIWVGKRPNGYGPGRVPDA